MEWLGPQRLSAFWEKKCENFMNSTNFHVLRFWSTTLLEMLETLIEISLFTAGISADM